MKRVLRLVVSLLLIVWSGCSIAFEGGGVVAYEPPPPSPPPPPREWTFIVYMAAENDLEAAAVADMNELEAVDYLEEPVTVLVLIDRIAGYDATNADWIDTRLYEITSDPGGNNGTIVSRRLDCLELGLQAYTATELDMADPLVLSRLISYAKREYPAENYGLIVWGHGTGWRSRGGGGTQPEPLKAIAFDDTTGHYMTLRSLGGAIAGADLGVIGFDTCFGGLMEVGYQVRNDTKWFVGSEGLIPATGWDYRAVFSGFLQGSGHTASDFCNAVISQFSAQYNGVAGMSIAKIDMNGDKMDRLYQAFNGFVKEVAEGMTSTTARAAVLNVILNAVEGHHFAVFPTDLYVDLLSLVEEIRAIRATITTDVGRRAAIDGAGAAFVTALQAAVPASWSKEDGNTKRKLGIYVVPLVGYGVSGTAHDLGYIKGSLSMNKSAFVEGGGNYWVPNTVARADSFLDKVFHWTY